jgi:hypothetical protein
MCAVLAGMLFTRSGAVRISAFLTLLAIHFGLGRWLLHVAPNPFIDVYVVHRDAMAAFLQGNDPYSISIPNIYGHTFWYGPGMVHNGRLEIGYFYPPMSLLLALAGKVLGGDYRYASLVAIDLAAILMAFARPGRLGMIAAASFLFMPRAFFVLEQGWTEPFVVFAAAAIVFVACRQPAWAAVPLGVLIAVKQYCVLALPVAHLIWARPFSWRTHAQRLGISLGMAILVTVPFVLWNAHDFWKSVVMFQVNNPFRPETLSFLAEYVSRGGRMFPTTVPFGLALLALALAAFLARWSPSGFAAGLALGCMMFFAFNKQAWCNYYYFVSGTLYCAVAGTRTPEDPEHPAT